MTQTEQWTKLFHVQPPEGAVVTYREPTYHDNHASSQILMDPVLFPPRIGVFAVAPRSLLMVSGTVMRYCGGCVQRFFILRRLDLGIGMGIRGNGHGMGIRGDGHAIDRDLARAR